VLWLKVDSHHSSTTFELHASWSRRSSAEKRTLNSKQESTTDSMAVLSDIEFTPDLYPPFPSASSRVDLPLATLKTISLMKILLEDDVAEQQRMFQACQSQGFFYLDLSGCEAGQVILEGADQVAQLSEKSFKLPVEEKLNYAYKAGDLFGYVCSRSLDN
jgi:hypothetical protein